MIPGGALVLLLAVAACRSHPPYRAPVGANPRATYEALVEDGRRGVPVEDEALWRCELGSAALFLGEEQVAFDALHAASRIMGTLESSTAENARAIFGAEATKTWKGDPYERCMNALYKGLLYYRRGDLGNASACFKRGLLADAWSEAGESQQDFAVLAFLLGWTSYRRGQHEQARFSFREAAALLPDNPWFADPRPDERNVLVVADIGPGPYRFADGSAGSLVRFARAGYPEGGIEISVDGVPAGRSARAVDLYHQATTRGDKVLDGIRQGKAVFKVGTAVGGIIVLDEGMRREKGELVAVGLGLLLLSALTNAEADTRCWLQLPAEVHILPLRIEPGRHTLEVRAVDRDGQPLPGWVRHIEVDVPAGGDSLYYFRTGPGRTIGGLTGPAGPS